ncbi:MAG: histidine kinase dimerization/phosphoacceptor domain -containing protein [Bacteroidota bacterium]
MAKLIIRPFPIAFLSFVILIMTSSSLIYLAYHSNAINQEKIAESRLNSITQLIAANLESKKQLANVLAGFVSYKGSIDSAEFDNFARHLIDQEESKILSLQWAPKGVITYLYPLESNREAKGLKLMEYQTTRDDTRHSLVNHKPHVNGPIPLVQGGTGIVYRVPVFSIDSLDTHGEDAFLGFAAVVVRLNEFLQESGIKLSDTNILAFKFASGAKERKFFPDDMFFGNKDLFKESIRQDTLHVSTRKWIVATKVQNLWSHSSFVLFLALAFLICLVASYFVYNYVGNILLLKHKNRLLLGKNVEIGKQVKEKMLLINEIHHRVKNNFQLVSSLARLQSYELKDPKSVEALQEFSNRVSSLALTHEQLLKKGDHKNETSIRDYINSLCENLLDKTSNPKISIEQDVEERDLPIKEVILIGIIINELITNSVKYAFVNRDKGRIFISFREKDGFLEFNYSDNGIGMESDVLDNQRESFGIDLIKSITEQLEGKINYYTGSERSGFRILFRPNLS